jgi:hypothetical protein
MRSLLRIVNKNRSLLPEDGPIGKVINAMPSQ